MSGFLLGVAGRLRESVAPRAGRERLFANVIGVALVVVLVAWVSSATVHAWQGHRRLHEYETAMNDQPGIVLTEATREGERFVLRGLRDPLAPDPAAALSLRGLDPSRATLHLKPFYSLDPRLIERRVVAALSPPPTVHLSFDRSVVRVTGIAPREWLLRARISGGVLPGVVVIDTSRAREREAIDEVRAARKKIEREVFRFDTGSDALAPSDDARFESIADQIAVILRNAAAAGIVVRFRVEAFGEDSAENKNARAGAVVTALVARGVERSLLESRAAAGPDPARRVVIHVRMDGAP